MKWIIGSLIKYVEIPSIESGILGGKAMEGGMTMLAFAKVAFIITFLLVFFGVFNSGTAFLWITAAGLLFGGKGGGLASASGSLVGILFMAVLSIFI
jgi:hypothetical protein